MSNESETNNYEVLNSLRLAALVNIVLFILPSSLLSLGFIPILGAKTHFPLYELISFIFILANPFVVILILSFVLSLKYFMHKKISKFSERLLKFSVFVNFITNLMAIGILQLGKSA